MKKKVKCWMIGSYCLVLAVFILIYLAIQHQTEKKIREIYMEKQLTVMNQAMNGVDEQVDAVTKMCLGIIQEPYVRYFPYVGTDLNQYDRENATKLLRDIRKHYTNDPFVEDFYLFYEKSGRIANANGFYPEEDFYRMEWAYEDPNLQRQAKELLRKKGTFFIPSAWMENGAKRTENIALYYEIGSRYGKQEGASAKLVVLLKKQWMDEMIMPLGENGKTSIRSADQKEELYSYYGKGFPRDFPGDFPDGPWEGTVLSWNRERYLLTRLNSEKTGWIYESAIPYRIVTRQVREAVSPMSAGLFLYLLAGIPACILLAVWNYKPIRQLAAHVEATGFGEMQGKRNEIEYIRSGISNLHQKYAEMELKYDSARQEYDFASGKLKKNRERIQEGILLQLIGGYWRDSQEIQERLQVMGIRFPYPVFCMAAVRVEQAASETEEPDAQEKDLRLFMLKNVAREFLEPIGLAILVPSGPEQVFLVMNLSEAGYEDGKVSFRLEELLREMMEYFQRELQITISIGTGTLCTGLGQLSESVNRSRQALEYCFILGRPALVIYDKIKKEGKGSFLYDVNVEKQLLGRMLQRDEAGCSRLLDELCEKAIKQKISVEEGKGLHMLLADAALKAVERAGVNPKAEERFQDMVAGVINSRTLPEAFPVIKGLFAALCREKEENEREEKLKEQVMNEITAHYQDPDFSLQMCAEHFKISPEHLSRTVKLLTGRRFVDIVNGFRLNKAKEYLAETDKKIEEIAALSGYGTAKSFFRSFKQAEGIPPGEWRKKRCGKKG